MEGRLRDLEQENDDREHSENMRFLKSSETPVSKEGSGRTPVTPQATNIVPTGFSPYSGSIHRELEPKSLSDAPMADEGPKFGWTWPEEDISAVANSTLSRGPKPGARPAPASLDLNTSKKRSRNSSNSSSDEHVAKSICATPSPALTGTTTPASNDSFDIGENTELLRLLGGDPNQHLRELRDEQRKEEEAVRARKEQERKDEAYARQLEEEWSAASSATASSSEPSRPQTTPSTFPPSHSQTYFTPGGSLRRHQREVPHPPPSIFKSSPSPFIKQQSPPNHQPHYIQIKHSTGPPRRFQEGKSTEFIDLGDSDDDYVDLTGHSSSPAAVNPAASNTNSTHRQLPWIKNEQSVPTVNGVNGLTNNRSPYSKLSPYSNANAPQQSSSNWASNWGNVTENLFQTGMNAAQNVYNAFLAHGNANTSYRSQTPYDTLGYRPAGSSSNPISFSDDIGPYTNRDSVYSGLNAQSIDPMDPRNQDLVNRYMDRYDYLTNDPTRTTEEIKSLLENIRPDEELPPENREGTPDAMTYPLMEHQKLGLAWMRKMEEGTNKGGILADDMGLGKTIQALALMVSRKSDDPGQKTTLIVAPVALLKQWEREIEKKLKPGRHRLTTFIMHGPSRGSTSWEKLRNFDVVLTTFGTLATELKRKDGIDMMKKANPNWRPTSKADHLPLLGDQCKWHRVIIDEAQCIKNKSTKAAIAAASLQATTRWCMTGTPMQNNVGELYSLIRFLRIRPYNVSERFNHEIGRPLRGGTGEGSDKAMQKLQALMKAILLRRTKKSTIDGKPILTLPERTTEVRNAEFNADEREFYRALETSTALEFNKYLKSGTVGKHYSNVLVLLLRLRQACCHPHLIKDFGAATGATELSMDEMMKIARELPPAVIAQIQDRFGSGLECPICFDADVAEKAMIVIPCGHNTCTECFAHLTDPSLAIANGDDGVNSNAAKCPQCRGQIDLKKVVNHEAFKRAHMPELVANENLGSHTAKDDDEEDDTDDESEDEIDNLDSKSDDSDSLRDFVVDDDVDEETTDDFEEEATDYRRGKNPFEKSAKSKKAQKRSKSKEKGKGKAKATPNKPKKTLAELKKEGAKNAKAHRRYLKRLREEYEPSAKIEKTLEILRALQGSKEGEKTIIFSQFTSLLDLLEVPISDEGWKYKRYDGSMTANARNQAVLEFSDKDDCKIMLVSLKAGNSGLNLVAASNVILFDPFWNPYIEEQAIDRAHRIGQVRPVKVHRILVAETVEDRIVKLQEQKRQLIENALDEKASQNIGRLDTRELAYLFGVPHN